MAVQSFRLLLIAPPGLPFARLFGDPALIEDELRRQLGEFPGGGTTKLIATLAPEWRFASEDRDPLPDRVDRGKMERLAAVTVVVQPKNRWDDEWIDRYAAIVNQRTGITVQADAALQSAFWAPGAPFGVRSQAHKLIGLDELRLDEADRRVNVVIVDQGFDGSLFPGRFRGGFASGPRQPGKGSSRHSTMIARAIHAIAPQAYLYDCPLIPTPPPGVPASIGNIPAFTLGAAALWLEMELTLQFFRDIGHDTGSWVFVNPWAIYDRASDKGPVRYSTNRSHLLNQLVIRMTRDQKADVVFAAGNCGQFEPDMRCGVGDRGPGRSILGANSLAEVLTAGAVRVDRIWLGYSSQGPGQSALGEKKPDLLAPSQFADDFDAGRVSTGTSTAAAVAAGAVAVLRGRWDQNAVDPATMRQALTDSAQPADPMESPHRTGAGIVDIGAAAKLL